MKNFTEFTKSLLNEGLSSNDVRKEYPKMFELSQTIGDDEEFMECLIDNFCSVDEAGNYEFDGEDFYPELSDIHNNEIIKFQKLKLIKVDTETFICTIKKKENKYSKIYHHRDFDNESHIDKLSLNKAIELFNKYTKLYGSNFEEVDIVNFYAHIIDDEESLTFIDKNHKYSERIEPTKKILNFVQKLKTIKGFNLDDCNALTNKFGDIYTFKIYNGDEIRKYNIESSIKHKDFDELKNNIPLEIVYTFVDRDELNKNGFKIGFTIFSKLNLDSKSYNWNYDNPLIECETDVNKVFEFVKNYCETYFDKFVQPAIDKFVPDTKEEKEEKLQRMKKYFKDKNIKL